MAKKLFTPDDYVLARVDQFPALYAAESFEQAKLRVYDQLFNVIGNGIRDTAELRQDMQERPFNRDRATRFCNGAQACWGYYDAQDFGDDFKIGRGESITAGDWEKDHHPDIVFWMDSGYCKWNPYPNFKKQYSIIWKADFRKVAGDDWVKEAVWYYGKCREWFAANSNQYHGAYPTGDQRKDTRYLDEMITARDRYESDEAFSKAYGHEYTGDMHDFMTRRSEKTKADVIAFIDETIAKFG